MQPEGWLAKTRARQVYRGPIQRRMAEQPMMYARFIRIMFIVASILTTTVPLDRAEAAEAYWQGDISTEWNTASNWCADNEGACVAFVPQQSGGFNFRAIIGTDNPNG